MPLASGSVSYLRFIAGDLPESFESAYPEALQARGFREIDPHSEVEQVAGWVRYDDAFASSWDAGPLVDASGHMLFRLRIDTLKIPTTTLKAYVDEAARARCVQLGRDKLNRREIEPLKLEIKKVLRKRSLPRLQLVDVVWTVATGEVRLLSTSRAVATVFLDIFEKTFSQSLRPVGLLTILWLRGFDEAEIDSLGTLEPERLHLLRG